MYVDLHNKLQFAQNQFAGRFAESVPFVDRVADRFAESAQFADRFAEQLVVHIKFYYHLSCLAYKESLTDPL